MKIRINNALVEQLVAAVSNADQNLAFQFQKRAQAGVDVSESARGSSVVVEITVPDEMPKAITEALEKVASDASPGTTINGASPLWTLQQWREAAMRRQP